MGQKQHTNHLAGQASPYLRQHVHNPVDWYPWGKEAFELAKKQDKPIFLSIGYATCHWCHVMEQESFKNPTVAALMNEAFVNVKVDREELPQVDSLYMEFAQAILGGGGGWPLNLVLTPELKPVFAATYLSPQASEGMLSLPEVIERVREMWNSDEKAELFSQADKMVEALTEMEEVEADDAFTDEGLIQAIAELHYQLADPIAGGIQSEPKFPMPHHLSFMLRYKDSRARFYAEKTLDMMQRGGIHDHLGGGFARYSVDGEWLVPHFEKMLYDNALAARAYLEGWQASDNELFRLIAEETIAYILREMTHEEGGFYSAEDADSEGEEGRFYTWTMGEVLDVLGDNDGLLFCEFYGIEAEGNFEGRNILHQPESLVDFCKERGLDSITTGDLLSRLRFALFQARQKRERPLRDEKIIVCWNGLMIRALSESFMAFSQPRYLQAATKAADFIEANMWKGGRLLRRWCEGESAFAGCLEDYAYLISGLLSLYKAGGDSRYLNWAIELSNVLSHEYKSEEGAFYRSDGSDPNLLFRQVELHDGAEPSGNAVHAENLLRLYHITGLERFVVEAEGILQHSRVQIRIEPLGGTYHGLALQRYVDKGAPTLVIALDQEETLHEEIVASLGKRFSPHVEVIWRRGGDETLFKLIPLTRDQAPLAGRTTLYLCREGTCAEPTNDGIKILETIQSL